MTDICLSPIEYDQTQIEGILTEFTECTSDKVQRKFKEIKYVGHGAYGKVVQTEIDGEMLAVKYSNNDRHGICGIRDIDMLRRIQHPNAVHSPYIISRMIEDENEDTEPFIGSIFPLAESNLHDYILRSNPSYDTRERFAYEIMSVINFLHENGLIYSDLKPENILIKNGSVLLSDFGTTHPKRINVWNSCTYFSADPYKLYDYFDYKPENIPADLRQYYTTPTTNYQQELWSLGATLFYLFSGKYIIGYPVDKPEMEIRGVKRWAGYFLERMNTFLRNRDAIIRKYIPERWVPLISRCFGTERNFKLNTLGYLLVSGVLLYPKRPKKITKNLPIVLTLFRDLNKKFRHPPEIAYLAMDIAFRIMERSEKYFSLKKIDYSLAIYLIANKYFENTTVDVEDFNNLIITATGSKTFSINKVKKSEFKVIFKLDGMIGNELISDHLPSKLHEIGLDWIIANTEDILRLSPRDIAAKIRQSSLH